MIIAHRGYSDRALENTLDSFEEAFKAGAKGIECDVRLTADGQAIINHNKHLQIDDQRVKISDYPMRQLKEICKDAGHQLLDLDSLFDYAKQKDAQFFLELKTSSPTLVESITQKLNDQNLWEKIHVMGFSFLVRNALRAQEKHPKLQVGQFLHLPSYSYIRKPKKSYCVFLGWLDGIPGSQRFFRTMLSPKRLTKLKKHLEKNGFNVKAGVINNDSGLKLFKQAGITDIVTDRVTETVNFFKTH